MSQRIVWVDALRGVAIVFMVIFHFCYDLRYFSYVSWDVPNGDIWRHARYIILSLFIFMAGFSLSLAYRYSFNGRVFFWRMVQLLLAALPITLMSWFLFPDAWIYFGVLHFMAVASALGIFFVRLPRVAFLMALLILLGAYAEWLPRRWPFYFFDTWLPSYTEDFVPLFPWLGVMLLGVGATAVIPLSKIHIPNTVMVDWLSWLGRKSLLIYLLHQPMLFAGFIALGFFFKG